VHSHASEVLAYTVNSIPLRPLIHTAGFLGPKEPPVWDIAKVYSSSESTQDLLVTTPTLGHSLASAFTPSTTGGFIMSTMKSALPNQIAANPDTSSPDHAVVLMRGHGFTTVATSIEAAVYQAIYTKEAAKVLTESLLTQAAVAPTEMQASVEGQVDVEGSGKLKGGKLKDGKITQKAELKYLSDKETKGTKEFIERTLMRPWSLWVREVEIDPLYRCDVERRDE
jgi:ribulose-5-phosphate 4-epimerase/fuculose-1-phosphate aldolase